MRDKFLTEAIGECCHEFDIDWDTRQFGDVHYCLKCHGDFNKVSHKVNDFSTWEGFGKLLTWCKEQDDPWLADNKTCLAYLTPDRFANAVFAYLNEGRDNE